MFPSPYREILVSSLSAILKPDTNIKSSTLLQAFATFTSLRGENIEHFISLYKTTFSQPPACFYRSRISHISTTSFSNLYAKTLALFTSLSPSEFFRFIIPDLVSNPIKAAKILHEKFSDDILLFAHHILRINIVIYSNDVINTEKSKNTLDRLYNIYNGKESITAIRLKKADFLELYNSICLYPLDSTELKI